MSLRVRLSSSTTRHRRGFSGGTHCDDDAELGEDRVVVVMVEGFVNVDGSKGGGGLVNDCGLLGFGSAVL